MFYSEKERFFYHADYPADDLPEDVVELSDSEYSTKLSAKFYAASTSGFYSIEVHGKEIPADAVEITDAEYTLLLDGQSSGLMISTDSQGRPILVERPPRSVEELSVSALARRDALLSTAAIRIAPLQDAVDLEEATDADTVNLKLWKQYRVAVNRAPSQPEFPRVIAWPVPPSE